MKDVELLVLKSFVYAVMRQKTLPETIQEKIRLIAASLDTRVDELGDLAESSPLLAPAFNQAYSYLTSSAAERGMGIDFPPADYDEDGPAHEPGNIVSAPERYQLDKAQETLDTINRRLNDARPSDADQPNTQEIAQALSSDNLYQALKNLFTP